jgi:hypothetical protein
VQPIDPGPFSICDGDSVTIAPHLTDRLPVVARRRNFADHLGR